MFDDCRQALRSFLKTPALAAVILLTLALGIGANTAIFSVVNAVLLTPAPMHDIQRLSIVWETDRNTGTVREPASLPDYLDFTARSRTFESLAAMAVGEVNLTPDTGDPARLALLQMTANALPMLGIRPIVGRTFTREEDRAGGPAVVVISESLWRRAFGGRASIVGETIRLDDRPHVIVGVMPSGADFGVLQILSAAAYSRGFADRGSKTDVDVWAPLQADVQQLPRSTHPLFVLGRVAAHATLTDAQAEMAGIAADLERAYPENAARGVHVESLESVVLGPARPSLFILLAAVALVLVIACVNVVNLLLARASTRVQETAVRCALGATQWRLVRQTLSEAVVLTLTAAISGIGIAYIGVRSLIAIAPPDVPRLSLARIDVPVLAATLATALLAAFVVGLIPVLQGRRMNVQASLSASRRTSAGPARTRLRSALVVAELAFAVLLVCGAALLIRSFRDLQSVDPGFLAQGVLKAEYQLPATRYPVDFHRWPDFREQHAFNAALLHRVSALPGVASAAIAGNHPLDPGFTNSFTIVGREAESGTWPEISIRRVTPSYFSTVGLQLARGRLFQDTDGTAAAPVAIINITAARRFFAGRDPIGASIAFWGRSRRIVGIVADERIHGLIEPAPIGVYTPLAQAPSANGAGVLLLRTAGDPAALEAAATAAIHDIDSGLAVFGVEPLQTTLSRSIGQRGFTMLLLGLFAAVALLLAAVGVHGVLSYAVTQRRRELGIRMALGARTLDIITLVARDGLTLSAMGLALGLAGAVALTRFLASQLFGVTATDPVTFAAVTVVILGVAAASIVAPAKRAARLDPVVTLRSE